MRPSKPYGSYRFDVVADIERPQLHPLVLPQVLHFMQVPLRTRVKLPQELSVMLAAPFCGPRRKFPRMANVFCLLSREDSVIGSVEPALLQKIRPIDIEAST